MKEETLIAQKLYNIIKTNADNSIKTNSIQTTYKEGVITSLPVSGSNKYRVTINGEVFLVAPREGLILNVGDGVLIALANGDINKRWIDLKIPY